MLAVSLFSGLKDEKKILIIKTAQISDGKTVLFSFLHKSDVTLDLKIIQSCWFLLLLFKEHNFRNIFKKSYFSFLPSDPLWTQFDLISACQFGTKLMKSCWVVRVNYCAIKAPLLLHLSKPSQACGNSSSPQKLSLSHCLSPSLTCHCWWTLKHQWMLAKASSIINSLL